MVLTDPDDLDWDARVDSYCFSVPSIFSFLGCLVVVLSVVFLKRLQTLTFRIIAIQMTAEGLYNLTHAIFFYPPKDKTFLCAVQGCLLAWSLNATILMTTFMSFHMYNCIKRRGYTLTPRRLYTTAGIIAIYAACVAAVPVIRNGYGLEGSQCWLAPHNTHLEHSILNLLVLFFPLWVCIVLNLYFYVTIYQYVESITRSLSSTVKSSNLQSDSSTSKTRTENVVLKLVYYPGIMIVCWTGITVYRVLVMARPGRSPGALFLWIAHVVLQLQGVLDTAVFLSYASVQSEYSRLYTQYFSTVKTDEIGNASSSGVDGDSIKMSEMIQTTTSPVIESEENNRDT